MIKSNLSTGGPPDDGHTMSEAAKLIGRKGLGRNNLYKLLREEGVLRMNNEPYQTYIDQGYFKVRQKAIAPYNRIISFEIVIIVTDKGVEFIKRLLTKKETKNAA